MSLRRQNATSRGFLIATIALCLSIPVETTMPADEPPHALTAQERQQQLQECERLGAEVYKLQDAGKLTEAVAIVQRIIAIERKVFGDIHAELTGTHSYLAELNLARGDFSGARKARHEALAIHTKLNGQVNWQTTDARLALADVDVLEMLTPEQRKRLDEVTGLNAKIQQFHKLRKLREAVSFAEEALAIRKELLGDKHRATAVSLNDIGLLLQLQGDYAGARSHYEQALAVRVEALGEAHPATAASLNNLGTLLRDMGDYAVARSYLERALEAHKNSHGLKHPDTATAFTNLGALLRDAGDYTHARAHFEEGLAIRKEILGSKDVSTAASLNNLGTLLQSQGDYADAGQYFEEALTTYKEKLGQKHPNTATLLSNLGFVLGELGDYTSARTYQDQALAIRKEILGDKHPDTATSLSYLGGLLRLQGDYAGARAYLEQALTIRKESLGIKHPDTVRSLSDLGIILWDMGDRSGTRACYEQVLAIEKEVLGKKHPTTASSLHNLGCLIRDIGDYASARPYLEQALTIQKEVLGDKHPATASSLHELGTLFVYQRDYEKARPCYEQALAIRKEVYGDKHHLTAKSVSHLGALLQSEGNYVGAIPYYEQALAMEKLVGGEKHPDVAVLLNNLGLLLSCIGDYASARSALEKSLAIEKEVLGEDHPSTASSLQNLGHLRACVGEFDGAAELLAQSIRVRHKAYESVFAGSSEAEALNFAATSSRAEYSLISVWRHTNRSNEELYGNIWPGRAALFQMVASRQGQLRKLATPKIKELYQDWLDVRREVARLTLAHAGPDSKSVGARRAVIEQTVQRKEQFERELARELPDFAKQRVLLGRPYTELQQALPSDTAFVDVVSYGQFEHDPRTPGIKGDSATQNYVAFVLTSGQKVRRVDLGPAAAIDGAATAWRQAIVEKRTTNASDELRRLVWEPIEAALPSEVRIVYLVPDGSLNSTPWAALPGKKPGTVLLEDYALAVVPNGQVLLDQLLSKPEPSEQDAILAVGGVQFDSQPAASKNSSFLAGLRAVPIVESRGVHWPDLPGTLVEIDDAQRLAGKRSVLKLTGNEASTERVVQELPNARWAVFATHGFFADPTLRSALQLDEAAFEKRQFFVGERTTVAGRTPLLLSGLVFAGANLPRRTDSFGIPHGDGGILTAEAIAGLDLSRMELAVLSACETGLGDVAGGEGVFGLQRAFHLAGSRNVVASLWKVDDQATTALMRLFYHKLWQENKSPLVALREAQLTLYRHPELIGKLASSRSPNFDKEVEIANHAAPRQGAATADVRLWAGFVLSGSGR